MTIVANKDGGHPAIDRPYCTYNRIVAAPPPGITTPEYAGEIVLDSAGAGLWKAEGTGNTSWVPFSARIAHP